MGFTVGRLILISLGLLIFFGVAERVLDRMHLTDKQAPPIRPAAIHRYFIQIF